jgi:acyl-CoA hydrolase
MPDSRPLAESEVRTSIMVMPEETNPADNLFGGALVAHIDRTAAISAIKHARANCVTASIDRLDFLSPARSGMFVHLHARVTFTATTSMEVRVDVTCEDPHSGRLAPMCMALLTFVALGHDGKPIPVPQLTVATPDEEQLREEGRARYERRRAERSEAKRSAHREAKG